MFAIVARLSSKSNSKIPMVDGRIKSEMLAGPFPFSKSASIWLAPPSAVARIYDKLAACRSFRTTLQACYFAVVLFTRFLFVGA
jgi:hypothetical protein